jgi:hypothetical protein
VLDFLHSPATAMGDDPHGAGQSLSHKRGAALAYSSDLQSTSPHLYGSPPKRHRGDAYAAALSLDAADGAAICECGARLIVNSEPSSLLPSLSPLQCRACANGQRIGSGMAHVSALSTAHPPRSLAKSFEVTATPSAALVDQEQAAHSNFLADVHPMFPNRAAECGIAAAAAAAAGPLHFGGATRDPLADLSQSRLNYAAAHNRAIEQHAQNQQHTALRAHLKAVARSSLSSQQARSY